MRYRKKQKEIEAVQWMPGVKIPGVVEMADLYPVRIQNKTEALWINPDGMYITISEGEWLVFESGQLSEPRILKDDDFKRLYEMAGGPISPSKASVTLHPEE